MGCGGRERTPLEGPLTEENGVAMFDSSAVGPALTAIPCVGSKTCPISGTACPGQCIYADVLASISLGIVVFDLRADTVLFCNRWARDFFERVGVPLDFDRLSELLMPDGSPDSDEGDAAPVSLRLGSRFLGHAVYRADNFAWVFLRDITEKARLEAIAEAVETTNSIGYIFSAVRHELGNPVNSIKVALSVLGSNIDTYSRETIAEYVERMSSEVSRIEHLLRSLRSFSLYERPEIDRVPMRVLCDELRTLVADELRARNIRLVLALGENVEALCDSRAMHQVLLNLVTNASDALAGRPDAVITVRCTQTESVVFLRVEDNGPGLSAEQMSHLFKPFNTTKPAGTGLGLVIARKLLAAMNGTIALESAPGSGTTAILSLQRASVRPDAEPMSNERACG